MPTRVVGEMMVLDSPEGRPEHRRSKPVAGGWRRALGAQWVAVLAFTLGACVKPIPSTGGPAAFAPLGPGQPVRNGQVDYHPTPEQLELILQQTESKGLKPANPVELPTPRHDAIPGEIVVRFKDGQVRDIPGATRLRDLSLPGTAVYRLAGTGKYSVQAVTALMSHPAIAYAEPNYKLRISAADGPDDPRMDDVWGYYQIRTHKLWLAGYKVANPIKVAVIDTGVDYNHRDLKGAVIKGANTVAGNRDPFDGHGHGTHVAGIIGAHEDGSGIVGVAAGAQIYAVKSLDDGGEGPEDGIAQGVMDAVNAGCKVINMSLGGPLDVQALRDAVAEANRRGVLVVVAAGNEESEDDNHFPAAYPEVLAVGATMPNDERAFFSNYGSFVDIAAPGVLIMSTLPDNEYDFLDGTSMAAPHVAGAAALLMSRHPELSVEQVKSVLKSTALPTRGFTHGTVGMINIRAAFEKVENRKIGPPDYNGGTGASPTPGPVYTPPPPPPLTQWYRAIAVAYDLYPTAENVDAFLAEVRMYETNGTLGPGTAQAPAVRDLQRALNRFGYTLPVSGDFDEATGKAVIAYKRYHGIHQTYRNSDGTWAINEYIDPTTFNAMMAQLFSAVSRPM